METANEKMGFDWQQRNTYGKTKLRAWFKYLKGYHSLVWFQKWIQGHSQKTVCVCVYVYIKDFSPKIR